MKDLATRAFARHFEAKRAQARFLATDPGVAARTKASMDKACAQIRARAENQRHRSAAPDATTALK